MPNYFPSEFSDLEQFGPRALRTEVERSGERLSRPYSESKALYDAVLPRIDEMLAHVEQFQSEDLPADVERLFWLALAFADVAPSVEWWDAKHSPDLAAPIDLKIYQ